MAMKTFCLFVLMTGWLPYSPIAQSQPTSSVSHLRQYVVEEHLASKTGAEKGILYNPIDSTILLAPHRELKPMVVAQTSRQAKKFILVELVDQTALYVTQSNPPTKPLGHRWSLAATLVGLPLLGPTSAVRQKMNETGWASVEPPGGCFLCNTSPVSYPTIYRKFTFDIELSHQVSASHGYQFGFGMSHNTDITGRVGSIPSATKLYLNNQIWYASFRWAWFSRNGRWVGSAGPSLLLFQDAQRSWTFGELTNQHRQLRPGLHLSGQFRFVNRRTWLLALKTDAHIAWPAYTRSYTVSTQYQPTYRLPETNIAALSLNIGLQVGFKFR